MGFGILRYLSSDPDVVAHMNKALAPQVFFNYFGPDNAKELGRLHKVEHLRRLPSGPPHPADVPDRHRLPTCIQDKMLIKWEYNTNLHKPETIKPLAQRCREVLRWFVDDYRTRGAGAAS